MVEAFGPARLWSAFAAPLPADAATLAARARSAANASTALRTADFALPARVSCWERCCELVADLNRKGAGVVTRLLAQLKRLVALHLSVQKPADTTGSFLIEVHPLRTALRARRRSQLAGSSGSAGSRCERHHQLLPASCCERSQRCERERGRSQRGWEHEGVPLAARCGWQRAARGRCERRGACPSQRC